MERLIDEIVQNVQTGKRTLIAISGHGAAGKSTLAETLRERLGDINLLHTDPYIIDSQLRKQTILTYEQNGKPHHYKMTACHPTAHHLLSLERDVRMIREGIGFYTIDVSYLERTWIDPKKMITIIEGMSVAFLDLSSFDQSIYLYTDGETEFRRRANRDIQERGMEMDYLRASHDERRLQYELFMHPYRHHFQTIVNTSGDMIQIEKTAHEER
ncbi:uridine kinase family protein [Exiguobacterium sp. B2(2022)]|uniref:uridine kinase family protein n=1 Tax=Exiguobacterium sp. B2(2022) TaxID=2992755 RepID=UPI00237AD0B9|nr:phosphoribulokinase [Exiguobacterium sp. B2(2022)]MDE0564728.1 phosphoribulokinase [Exiguobacterium sp. B2(2022)]